LGLRLVGCFWKVGAHHRALRFGELALKSFSWST
jgi:hypothetical protein